MQRVTVTLDEDLMRVLDRFIAARGYQNRSEAIRDLARRGLRQATEEGGAEGGCVGALVFVYETRARDLPKRLTRLFHDHHDISVAALQVRLDHEACLELNVLRGDSRDVRGLADTVIAQRGVRHGRLVMVPAEIADESHSHGNARHRHPHTHVRKAG